MGSLGFEVGACSGLATQTRPMMQADAGNKARSLGKVGFALPEITIQDPARSWGIGLLT
jgi:hypothetical protein